MSDNIMSPDINSNSTEPLPVVQKLDNGVAYGYQCAQVMADNTVAEIPLTFFVDLSFPFESEDFAISYVQQQLVEAVSEEYGVSDGSRCDNPLLDGTSWLVQFISQTTDWTKDFDSCLQLAFDPAVSQCHVYKVTVTGSALDGNLNDVLDFMGTVLNGGDLTSNSPYGVQYLGIPQVETQGGDSARDNLGEASNVNQINTIETVPEDKPTITVLGGLLVAGFAFAFCGILFLLYRRRRQWLKQADAHYDLDKQYGTHPSEEFDEPIGGRHYDDVDPNGTQDEDEVDSAYRNHPITFDLGTSFKDQLMGVHGSSTAASRGRPPRGSRSANISTTSSSIGAASPFPRGDAMSDSDADSWAQTDGTIGSLELQLEPITAEV